MKRFVNRIIICLLPVVIASFVVAWAYNEFRQGRGGFRLGVDLAGGTILVYEVDETKMPQDFKAEDLAAVLDRESGRGGSKERRLLTSEEVENIKSLIEKQGRLEFRILANRVDDSEGIAAAEAWMKDPKNAAELGRLEVRAEPPPP